MSSTRSVGRRGFIQGAATGAAAFVAQPAAAAQQAQAPPQQARPAAAPPSDSQLSRETTTQPVQVSNPRLVEKPQSDYMVDVIKALGIEYLASNPGSSFEGLHESLINYGENSMPEFLTACHEESAVAMAHGYAKIEGKPMLTLLHGTIGIQHASMAIYNAYCDRVPIYMIAGVDSDGPVAAHNAVDMAAMARDFVKWDHQPESLGDFTSSAMRAYRLMMTPPQAPVLLVVSGQMQKAPLGQQEPPVPRLVMPSPPSADIGSVRDIAKMLVAAENPRVQAGRAARTAHGITLLVELAELLQMPVNVGGDRVNFPSRHPLGGNGAGQPDLILMLEGGGGPGGPANQRVRRISISSSELLATSNYNVLANQPQADMAIAADAEATLPALIEEVRKLITPDRRRLYEERGRRHATANHEMRQQAIEQARFGWDSSPISTARITAELWPLIRNEDWSLVSPASFFSNWPVRLWNMDTHYRYIGGQDGGGMGYGLPAAVGAALANRKYGRLSINIQTDGDFNYAPGVLWTAAHHKIPLLTIMHNNKGYHQEVMYVQQMCSIRNRGGDRAHIGTKLWQPDIQYARVAEGYGMYAEGPISDPKDLRPALERALEHVKKGEPALLDVVTQPR